MSSQSRLNCEPVNPNPILPNDIGTWPDVMDIEQLRQALGLRSKMVVYRMLQTGKLSARKVGKQYRFTKAAVLQWLQDI